MDQQMPRATTYILMMILLLQPGCKTPGSPSDNITQLRDGMAPKSPVKVEVIERRTFNEQIYSYGKVMNPNKMLVRSKSDGFVTEILAEEGIQVQSGDTLIILDTIDQWYRWREAQERLIKARIDLEDMDISMGLSHGSSARDSAIRVQSGYNTALLAESSARSELNERYILAPVDGTISRLMARENEFLPRGGELCEILSGNSFDVKVFLLPDISFRVLPGTEVTLGASASKNKPFYGRVKRKGTFVNDEGYIEVLVESQCPGISFPEGYPIKAIFHIPHGNSVVVQKESVVFRSGKRVVFTAEKGRARWHTITIGGENSQEYLIHQGVTEGDTLIVSGNLFLAHDAPVDIINDKSP